MMLFGGYINLNREHRHEKHYLRLSISLSIENL
jgi:hypothetical protein